MKHFPVISMAVAVLFVGACHNTTAPILTKVYSFEDSTAHARMQFSAELPNGADKVSRAIREDLLDVIDNQLGHIVSYEGERQFDAFDGDRSDAGAFLKYYFDKSLDILARESDKDARDREMYMSEDADMDEAEKAAILANMPGWEYEFCLSKIADTTNYVVFQSQDYVYMGGAHGGITGAGFITYDKVNGSRVEQFVDPDCAEEIQPLIRQGLVDYFGEGGLEVGVDNLDDVLLLEGTVIPLPAWPPFPSANGLEFVYQQYEIAPYAAGMPSFSIPFADLEPYLTKEARRLMGL